MGSLASTPLVSVRPRPSLAGVLLCGEMPRSFTQRATLVRLVAALRPRDATAQIAPTALPEFCDAIQRRPS